MEAPNGRRRPGRGVGELDVAAPFEVSASSFAARTVPIAEAIVTTDPGWAWSRLRPETG